MQKNDDCSWLIVLFTNEASSTMYIDRGCLCLYVSFSSSLFSYTASCLSTTTVIPLITVRCYTSSSSVFCFCFFCFWLLLLRVYVNVVITNQVPQTSKKVIFEENHLVEIKTNLSMEGLEQKNARDASLKHPWNKQREGFLGSIFARHVPPFSGCKRLTM